MAQNSINSKNQVIQFVSANIGTLIDCSTPTIPADDTIPQNTEGTEVLTLAITPIFSTSKLKIVFSGMFSCGNTTTQCTIALFQDSTANALAANCFDLSVAIGSIGLLQYVMTSGTTSSTTFKIRAGPASNNFYMSSQNTGAQIMGGVAANILTIEEYI
jgi:hypothetical protein